LPSKIKPASGWFALYTYHRYKKRCAGQKRASKPTLLLVMHVFGKGKCKVSVEKKNQLTEKQFAILQSEMKKHQKSVGLAYVLCIFLGFLAFTSFT